MKILYPLLFAMFRMSSGLRVDVATRSLYNSVSDALKQASLSIRSTFDTLQIKGDIISSWYYLLPGAGDHSLSKLDENFTAGEYEAELYRVVQYHSPIFKILVDDVIDR